MTTPPTAKPVRRLGDSALLSEGSVNVYYLGDLRRRVSVARVNGQLYAFDDLCTHEGCPLSSGLLTGTTIMCQCHGSRFDITNGSVVNGPAVEPVGSYEVSEADGAINISI